MQKGSRTVRNNLVGKKFGKLTVLSLDLDKIQATRPRYWICKCDCGIEKSIRGTNLTRGETTSCGCYNREHNQSKETNLNSIGKGKYASKVKDLNKDKLTFNQFCKSYGLTPKVVRQRFKKGWSIHRTLNTPVDEPTLARMRSNRAKGKKLEDYVVSRILHHFPELVKGDDVERVPSGRSGIDVKYNSQKARKQVPVSFECKNTTEYPGKKAIEQAQKNKYDNTLPVVAWHPAMEKYSDTLIICSLEDLLEWVKKYAD
jgi:hypothetical protein